jgi:hypothetical protein
MKQHAGLPVNINLVTPVPRADAQSVTRLIRRGGRVEGYELSDGSMLTKEEGVALAKAGGIRGVAVAVRSGSEYLRSLPDGNEGNNLGSLPSTPGRGN